MVPPLLAGRGMAGRSITIKHAEGITAVRPWPCRRTGNRGSFVNTMQSRATRGVLGAALLALSGFSANAHAAAVFQNDAGSRGDAGDVMQMAVPITPGYHTASLSPAGDLVDWYKIHLTKGDKLRLRLSDYSTLDRKTVAMRLLSPAGDAHVLEPEGLMLAANAYSGHIPTLIAHETGTWYLKAEAIRDGVLPGDYGFRLDVTPGHGTVINTRNQAWIVLEMHAAQPTEVLLQGRMQGQRSWDQAYWGTLATERELDGQSPGGFGVGVRGGGQGTSTTATAAGLENFDVFGPALATAELDGSMLSSWSPMGVIQGYVRFVVALSQDDPWLNLAVWADQPITIATTQGSDKLVWSEANSGAEDALVTPLVSQIGSRVLNAQLDEGFRGTFDGSAAESAAAYTPDGASIPLHPSCQCVVFRPSRYLGWTQDAWPGSWRFELGETLSGPYRTPYLAGVLVDYPGLF